MGPEAAEALPVVRGALTDNDSGVRSEAVRAFARICRDPAVAIPVLAHALPDSNNEVRETAAEKLEKLGSSAINPVLAVLADNAAPGRSRMILVLRRVASTQWIQPPVEVVDAVRALTGDPEIAVRAEALMALVAWGKPSLAEVKSLLGLEYTGVPVYPGPNETASSVPVALGAITRFVPAPSDL